MATASLGACALAMLLSPRMREKRILFSAAADMSPHVSVWNKRIRVENSLTLRHAASIPHSVDPMQMHTALF